MNTIQKGDKVRILPNVTEHMRRLEFTSPELLDDLIGTEQEAMAVWDDKGQKYVTIDLCVEVPIEACEKVV